MTEVVALGEALIDFTPMGKTEAGNPVFERNPGGAPANVLAQLARLGVGTAFIGKVGDDMFGRGLQETMQRVGINTERMIFSGEFNTTLAFVQLSEQGDRSFCFVRRFGADKMLTPEEVDFRVFDGAKAFHFGGVTLTEEPARTATLACAAEAGRRGLLVSYDPNYRPLLWHGDAAAELRKGLLYADILKVSDEECRMLSGKENLAEGSAFLSREYDIPLVFVTLGSKGSAFRFGDAYVEQPTFDVRTIDTTGAGDSFFGSMLYCILQSHKNIHGLTVQEISGFMRFANAAGSLVTTRKGALLSMATLPEIQALMEQGRMLATD